MGLVCRVQSKDQQFQHIREAGWKCKASGLMSVVRIHVVKKKKKVPGDFREQYKELMYGTMPI